MLRLEEHAGRPRGLRDTTADFGGRFVGSFAFVAVHLVAFTGWVVLNTRVLPGVRAWDPYPFNFLSALTSMEAVLVTAFVLISQNRMARLADRRDHLDLQVNLLAEQEASMIIQMLDRISRHLGLPEAERADAMALSRTATLENLASQLHAQFPDTEGELTKEVTGR